MGLYILRGGDEFGNAIPTSNDIDPWRQALLDEMRAVRLGIQVLCDYMNPGSGTSPQPNPVSMVRDGTQVSRAFSNEVDLIAWAQSIRDGSDEVIQG